MGQVKTSIDVESLLHWAYRDELSKRQLSSAEGIWDRIQDFQNHGGVDSGRGAAQRYSHFGLPDQDAIRIEQAVSALTDQVIDWNQDFELIVGDLSGLISINEVNPAARPKPRDPKFGWGEDGSKALKAYYGAGNERPFVDRPRDVIMVGGIKTNVLVTSHAIKGTRPDWGDETPIPQMTPHHLRPSMPAVIGSSEGIKGGRPYYSMGSHCPLRWYPSPLDMVTARVDYLVWHRGLAALARTLELEKFIPLPPKAPAAPWIEGSEEQSRVVPVVPNGRNDVAGWGKLALAPHRGRAGSAQRIAKAGPVRYPLAAQA